MTEANCLPHDLLWLSGADAVIAEGLMPAWAREALARMPVAVVRRASCGAKGWIAIGLRGPTRAQRCAASVPAGCICKRVRPEDLVAADSWRDLKRRSEIAAVWTLEQVRQRWRCIEPNGTPLQWGPTGSVGFELATAMPVAQPGSDLDLVLRAPRPLPTAVAGALLEALQGLPARVDVQMETPTGCVVLSEYAQGNRHGVLLRTSHGPKLVQDPWKP